MSYLIDKPDFSAQIYNCLLTYASVPGKGTDGMKMIQLMAGVIVETLLLFDDPDEGLVATIYQLGDSLGCDPAEGALGKNAMPPAYITDHDTENGREVARLLFEDWLNCAHEFHELIVTMLHHILVHMEVEANQPRQETFRIFVESATRCLSYEIAAQELCEIVIERKIGKESWRLSDSINGLSAIAGRRVALFNKNPYWLFSPPDLPDHLHHVSFVMTGEAVRLNVPAGADWRTGLAANDCPSSAPYNLIMSLEPECWSFFRALNMTCFMDQAVSCAKAAGRMLAVAAGGNDPDIEPVIAKRLAMAAMTETYRTVCRKEAILSC